MRSCVPSSEYEVEAGLDATGLEGHEEARRHTGPSDPRFADKAAETGHGDVVRLKDVTPPEWRLRIGDRRTFFQFDDDRREIHVLRVRRRDQAY